MFREFYGFTERPFSRTPDPRFLYLGKDHREGLARLQYAVEERELALLTGEVGCGKTTLSRAVMDSLGEGYRFCFIFNPRLDATEFLRVVVRSLGGEGGGGKDALISAITDLLYGYHQEGVTPVVVIDEAQLVAETAVFDEIRLLTNFQLDDRNLLSVIIMGQPELRETLRQPVYEPLRQRIAMQYHLEALSPEETQEYVDFRVAAAGGSPGLFTSEAVGRIHELSGGIPRRINAVATNALLAGFGLDAAVINAGVVATIATELVI